MIHRISTFTFVVLAVVISASDICWASEHGRVHMRRDENQPLVRNLDRSVYARRNFALPDIVSDVYEVYVGPSVLQEDPSREAVCIIQGKPGSGVHGVVSFRQNHPNLPVILNGTIRGLMPGKHGFHVHQKGDLRDGCTSAGGHFNPYMQTHGAPMDRYRHVGDLGNIEAGLDGVCNIVITDSLISLSGVNSIIGRGLVVHEKPDDLGHGMNADSKTTGNSGGRLGCGVIGLA